MSELIAEARVLVTPDTTAFRAQLTAQLAAATKGIVVPIPVTAVASGVAGQAATAEKLAVGTAAAAVQQQKLASEIEGATAARHASAAAMAVEKRQADALTKGIGTQAAAFAGLRGATLAASGPFIAGAAAAIAFGKAVQLAASFQSQLNTFRVVAGATADEMKNASAAAQDLGRDISLPGVSASDAAEAFTELAKAGLSVQDSLAGAKGVLQLATAAQISNAEATELAASALNAFGLSGQQAVHVADVLANAANDAQGSITDIGIALQQASAAGRQAGLSLEETTAILTEFARNGIKGSDAGTLLRTLLIRLINPTTKAAAVIKQLGLNVRDATGAIDVGVFQQFADATRDLTPAARDQAAAIIAGQDAFRGLSILAREGGAALDAQVTSLDKTGTAAEVAGARMQGLSGQANQLQSNLETLGITIGEGVNPFLEGMARGLNLAIGAASTGASGIAGFLQGLGGKDFDQANANLDELLQHLNDLQEQTRTGPGEFEFSTKNIAPELQKTSDQVAALGAAFRALGPQGVQKFVTAFTTASPLIRRAMEDNVITPLEKAQLSTTALGRAFLAGLPKSVFVGLGATIRSGLEDATAAAKVGVADLGPEIHSGIEDASREAVVAARQLGTDMGDALKTSITDAIAKGASAVGPAVSNLQLALAQASGNQGQELAVLKAQQARQQKFLDAVLGRDQTAKNVALATKAAQNLKQTNAAIKTIQDQQQAARDKVVSDAKQNASATQAKAQAAQTAQAKADQAVLDSFAPAKSRLSLAAISANASARLSDDVKLQNAIIAEANRENEIIRATVNDKKTKNAALAANAEILKAANLERDRIIAQIAANATENRRKAADAITAALGKQITLAELRENDSAEVTAINKAIANARKRIAQYKKLGLNLLDEKIALEELINKRDEVTKTKEEAAGGKAGLTIAEILQQNVETFNRTGGNLVTGNQPFAGPTGFTADVAQFLHRAPTTTVPKSVADVNVPLITSNAELIRVIQENTDAIRGTTGGAGMTPGKAAGLRGAAMAKFYKSRQALQLTEAESP